jgi:lipopolysaccharide transport system permease protein
MEKTSTNTQTWTQIMEPHGKFIHFSLRELWDYRDLLKIFIHRNIVTVYKQTVLGWLWFIINPVITTVLYMFVFGGIAGISTDGQPQSVFYMAGILLWNYFSACFSATSNFLAGNANLFSKSYFPRLILPISGMISSLITFGVQAVLLIAVYLYFSLGGVQIRPTIELLALPIFVILLAGTAFSWGLICSSLTIKYRDLDSFIRVGMSLIMYITPVVYPMSVAKERSYGWVLDINPLTGIFESFRYSITGLGAMDWSGLLYCFAWMCVTLLIGLIMFTRAEGNFIDTV